MNTCFWIEMLKLRRIRRKGAISTHVNIYRVTDQTGQPAGVKTRLSGGTWGSHSAVKICVS